MIQEQNSYAGITNKLLGKKSEESFVWLYDHMEKLFSQKKKIVLTGNPVRKNLLEGKDLKKEAIEFFQLGRIEKDHRNCRWKF